MDLCPHHRHVVVSFIWPPPRQCLEQDTAERVDVGASVEWLALDLLGSGIWERPKPKSGLCVLASRVDLLGESEVRQINVFAGIEQHVRRLYIPVDEASFMRGIEAASDFRRQPGSTRWRERSLDRKELRKVGAGDIAHRDIEMAVGFAGLKDRNDVRMIDRGGQLRLPLESFLELRIATM